MQAGELNTTIIFYNLCTLEHMIPTTCSDAMPHFGGQSANIWETLSDAALVALP